MPQILNNLIINQKAFLVNPIGNALPPPPPPPPPSSDPSPPPHVGPWDAGTPAAGGTAGTILSVTPTWLDRYNAQRYVYTGNPAGWSSTWVWGSGSLMSFNFTSASASSGLFARFFDRNSPNFDPNVDVSGTLLQNSVKVMSNVISGVNSNVVITIGASTKELCMELSLDGAFTNPFRVPLTFGCGDNCYGQTRSQMCGFGSSYPIPSSFTDPSKIVTLPDPTASINNTYPGNVDSPIWETTLTDWTVLNGYNSATTGRIEWHRLVNAKEGVRSGLLGQFVAGGDYDVFWDLTGTNFGAGPGTYRHVNNQVRWQFNYMTGGPHPYGRLWKMITANAAWSHSLYPAHPAIYAPTGVTGSAAGCSSTGPWRDTNIPADPSVTAMMYNMAKTDPYLIPHDATDWDATVSFHCDMFSRVHQARSLYRHLKAREAGVPPGPYFIGQAVRDGYVIRLPFQHAPGGRELSIYRWQEIGADPNKSITETRTATVAFIMDWVATLYPSGMHSISGQLNGYKRVALDPTNGFTIDNVNNEVVLQLDASSVGNIKLQDGTIMPLTNTTAFDAWMASADVHSDLSVVNGPAMALVDDNLDLPGVTYGHQMMPTRKGIYVPAITPVAQSIVMNPVLASRPNSLISLSGGPGTGPPVFPDADGITPARVGPSPIDPATGIEVQWDGGARIAPLTLVIWSNNAWSGYVTAPSTTGSHTLNVYRVGQSTPDIVRTVVIENRIALLAGTNGGGEVGLTCSGNCVAVYDARSMDTLFQNKAGTTPVTEDAQPFRGWRSEINSADLLAGVEDAPSQYGSDWNIRSTAALQPALCLFGGDPRRLTGTPAFASSFGSGDFTIALVTAPDQQGRTGTTLGWAGGAAGGISCSDGGRVIKVTRGVVSLTGPPTGGVSTIGLDFIIFRYTMASDKLELFTSTGSWASPTLTTSGVPLTLGALSLGGGYSGFPFGAFFNVAMTNADKDAMMAWMRRVFVNTGHTDISTNPLGGSALL